ncbi:MAG TPA: SAM-dependent methyltransferase [Anaerolineaceae bacterium]|nr:SAM-dependent methyltransferase [Anaerolineaceae bacterium]
MSKSNLGEQNYEPFAERYAQSITHKPHNAYYERPATLSLLPDVHGSHVLDAGCGSGLNTEWLLDHSATVTAVDATPKFVQMTHERCQGNATVFQWDLQQPLIFAEDESFDLILCSLVLDYIENWVPLFHEFHRILKPAAFFVFSCGHPASDFYREWQQDDYFAVTLHAKEWQGFGEPYPIIHSYRRPMQSIINSLIQTQFEIETFLETQPSPDHINDPAHEKIYQRLMREPCFLHIRAVKR